MSRPRALATHSPSTPRRSGAPAAGPIASLFILAALLVAPAASAATVPALRLTMENDLLVTDQDDLYTFAVDLELERGPYTYAFRENAFTDRAAGVRFDESELTVGRALSVPRPWSVHAELGLVHVGRGLFGERAQNAVHGLIGGEEVELPYADSSLHGRASLVAHRPFALARRLDVGPLLEVETIPGLRSHVVLAAQAGWRPHRAVDVFLVAGARATDVSQRALERHALGTAAVARLGVVLYESVYLTWTYNDYGVGREHLALGYRVPTSGGRQGAARARTGGGPGAAAVGPAGPAGGRGPRRAAATPVTRSAGPFALPRG